MEGGDGIGGGGIPPQQPSLQQQQQQMDPIAYQAYYQQYIQYYQQYMQAVQQQSQQGLPSPIPQQQQQQQQVHHIQHAPHPHAHHPPPPPTPSSSSHQQYIIPTQQQQQQQQQYNIPTVITSPPPIDQISTSVVWVGYLPPMASEDEIRDVFQQFGPLESVRPLTTKNCAFIKFSDRQDAWKCVQAGNQRPLLLRGQSLKVGWGRIENEGTTNEVQQNVPPRAPPSNSLWVGGIPDHVTEEDLRGPFSRFGKVAHVRILPQKKCAFLEYFNVEDAEKALQEMQGFLLLGSRLRLNFGLGGKQQPTQQQQRRPIEEEDMRLAPVPEAPRPDNDDVAQVIETLAQFVHRLGISFEEKVKDLQKGNPRFEFLFEGQGADYYNWRKYDLKDQENRSTSMVAPWARGAGAAVGGGGGGGDAPWARGGGGGGGRPGDGNVPDPSAVTLSTAELSRLSTLMDNLKATQDSIRESKDWIMARAKLANDIVSFLRSRVAGNDLHGGFDQRLFILYLINDVLLHSTRARQEGGADYFTPAFQPALGDLCGAVYATAAADDQREKVLGLLTLWASKGFYAQDFLQRIRDKLQQHSSGGETNSKRVKVDPYGYQ